MGFVMTDGTLPTTRRTILSMSAAGVCATVDPSAAVADNLQKRADIDARTQRIVPDRAALEAHPETALGNRIILTEGRRRGEFVARARSSYRKHISADPHQAFCVVSTVSQDVVWVRDFTGPASLDWGGAMGNGVIDDAPFINAMLQNTFVSWFQIEDQRNHHLATSLIIRRPLTLIGAGFRNSVFSVSGLIDGLLVELPSASDHGLHLASFGLVNKMPAGTSTKGAGIRLQNVYLAALTNLEVKNFWNGLHSTRCGLSKIDVIHIDGSCNAGMLFDGGDNFDTRVSAFTISGGVYAIRLDDMCDELIFTDGVCSSAQYALYTHASAYAVNRRPEFCRFSRVSFDNCINGLDLANCTDIVFDACFISCRPNHGAVIGVRGSVENIQFVATTFFNNGMSAAVIGRSASELDFVACKFVSNCTTQEDTYDTIVFSAGCGSFSLAHNRFRPGWDVHSSPRYQVRIERGGTASYSLLGNHFNPGSAGTLLDERSGDRRSLVGNVGL